MRRALWRASGSPISRLSPQADEGFPVFAFTNFATVGDSNYRPVISPDMVEKYQDNLTWIKGRHSMVFGADMQFWQVLREEAPFSPHGQIYFNGQFSSLGQSNPECEWNFRSRRFLARLS